MAIIEQLMNARLMRGPCLDDRSERVAFRLKQDYPTLTVYTEQIFFLRLAAPLTLERQQKIASLLSAWYPCPPPPEGEPLVVTPRPGTISPWSSKAGDILTNCGFHEVARVEQGRVYFLNQENLPLTSTQLLEFYDPMTEALWRNTTDVASLLFAKHQPSPLTHIDINSGGLAALQASNHDLSLALSADEMDYLLTLFHRLKRNPTDAELMMFAQANSEHCRHKIFNAAWKMDNQVASTTSLFDAIRQTHRKHPAGTLVAYDDNAAVLEGCVASTFAPNAEGMYENASRLTHLAIKVETHNHPTAIAPFPGAATGVGGEIRDELATGRGGKPVAGLCGYAVSNLRLPNDPQPWEKDDARPPHLASPLEIMIEAPLGAAAYANEIGRCTLAGFFRTYEQHTSAARWGYFKPIMLAGGVAHIYNEHVKKLSLPTGAALVQLGGPAMLIGLGGGASSSLHSGSSSRELDFASVQRGNAEMERRVLEVILSCLRKSEDNPILSIHDVGAGGLSNALPELVHGASRGGVIDMNAIPSADEGLSPLQLWCNEAQERMVLAVAPEKVDTLKQICLRERCPMAVVGEVSAEEQLRVQDGATHVVDLALKDLIGALPQKIMHAETFVPRLGTHFDPNEIDVGEALLRVLQLPAVAAKNFLITIGDRTVGGLTARDQMIGPYQRAVSDCAVTGMSFEGHRGQAFAMGEKSPLALLHPAASARMAVGEALTNLAAARLSHHGQRIKLSANWMAAAGDPQENHALWLAVTSITDHFCDEVGFSIPVGKDSLSMKASWQEKGKHFEVASPVSLVVSAFALCEDIRDTFTAELVPTTDSALLLVDLGDGHRLGGSALAQVYGTTGETPPDANGKRLAAFMALMQDFHREEIILAYHDRSDGGVLTTLCEMAFASHVGLDIFAPATDTIGFLFNEELGAVVQVREKDRAAVQARIEKAVGRPAPVIARIHGTTPAEIRLSQNGKILRTFPLTQLLHQWMKTSHAIQLLRDNADCAREEFAELDEPSRLFTRLTFTSTATQNAHRPRVMILREQGTNGHVELAKAFSLSGFEAVDVHMSDLLQSRKRLTDFQGLAMGGGFSYGDVLGAGCGWANTILHHEKLKNQFAEFFARADTFTVGICNGCQALANLQSLIPGVVAWPAFTRNRSQRFEARLVLVEVVQSPSPLFSDMAGSVLPVVVSHGEGRVKKMPEGVDAVLRYVDGLGHPATHYPQNPNGSHLATAGICSPDGRVTLMMPHPERVFLPWQMSWLPKEWRSEAWQTHTPWLEMFRNIRRWVS